MHAAPARASFRTCPGESEAPLRVARVDLASPEPIDIPRKRVDSSEVLDGTVTFLLTCSVEPDVPPPETVA
jgi:hypothetical protein